MDCQLSVSVPAEMKAQLEHWADKDERSVSYHVRQAIKEYLAKGTWAVIEQYRKKEEYSDDHPTG